MTNKEAIDTLKTLFNCYKMVYDNVCKGILCRDCRYDIPKEQILEALYIALKTMESTESGGWIPCNEKMPETHQSDFWGVFSGSIRSCKVLVTSESGDVFECRAVETMYSELCWIDANECQRDDIIAWMPLPEPYKGCEFYVSDEEWREAFTKALEALEEPEQPVKPVKTIPDSIREAVLNVLDDYADKTMEIESGAYEQARYAICRILD